MRTVRGWLVNVVRLRRQRRAAPAVGALRFGDLRRLEPFDRNFGYARGQPIDRYYIARFLEAHADDVRGRVLEVGDDLYTRRFGGAKVAQRDVLFPDSTHRPATIIGDLGSGAGVPLATFDCALITQTLLLVYDLQGAVHTLHRSLKAGGILLVTLPGICQIARDDDARWGDMWRFTPTGVKRLFGDVFGPHSTSVTTFGNVLSAASFLYGVAAEELRVSELDHHDPDYPVTIAVRAVKN